MNTFLQSNKSSALLSVVGNAASKDLYDYKTSATPNPALERVEVTPNGGQFGFDQVVTFDIPAYGIIESLIFSMSFTSDNTTTVRPVRVLLELMDYMEIASQNKIISRLTRDEYIGMLTHYDDAGASAFDFYSKKLSSGNNTTLADHGRMFLPWMGMLSGMKSEFSSRLDSSFTERLQFRIRLGPASAAFSASAITPVAPTLICNFTVLPEAEMKRLHEVNYSAGPLVLLNSTSYDEGTVAVAASDTSKTVKITTNGVVKRTTIRVIKDSSNDDVSQNEVLSSITLSGSGRELLKFHGTELLLLHKGKKVYNSLTFNVYQIDYTVGALPNGSTLGGFAGGASFREIADPTIEVQFTALGGSNTGKVHVSHEVLELISVLGSNGRIQQNIST